MKANNEITDALISQRIKELGLDEPSADFTRNIMQTVSAQPVIAPRHNTYWWWLSLIPVLGAMGWYVWRISGLVTGYLAQLEEAVARFIHPFIQAVSSFPELVKSMKVSPLLVAGFLAIVVLLTIEELQRKAKQPSS